LGKYPHFKYGCKLINFLKEVNLKTLKSLNKKKKKDTHGVLKYE